MYALDYGTTKARGELALSAQAQKEHGILNGTASVEAGNLGDQVPSTFQFFDTTLLAATRAWNKGGRKGPPPIAAKLEAAGAPPPSVPRFFHLMTRQEQAPNPNSRVTLSTEKDPLGMPRAARLATHGIGQALHSHLLQGAWSGDGAQRSRSRAASRLAVER